jgi:hypothetical protein
MIRQPLIAGLLGAVLISTGQTQDEPKLPKDQQMISDRA